jgi:hypothetical protein
MGLRGESSVSPDVDEMGELVFPGSCHGTVIHRTPEELGLPRVVVDAPARVVKDVRLDWGGDAVRSNRLNSPMRAAAVRRDRVFKPQTFAGVAASKPGRADRGRKVTRKMSNALGGGTAKRAVPSKRYAAPKFGVVTMDRVPEPETNNAGHARQLWQKILELKPRAALMVEFEAEQHADSVRTQLRSLAKKAGKTLLSSRGDGGKTRWFWL